MSPMQQIYGVTRWDAITRVTQELEWKEVVCINSVYLNRLNHYRNDKGTNAGQNYRKGTSSESMKCERRYV
jgi:hypothetical protein